MAVTTARLLEKVPDFGRDGPRCTDTCNAVIAHAESYFVRGTPVESTEVVECPLALLDLRAFTSPDDYLRSGFNAKDRKGIKKAEDKGWIARRLSAEEWNTRLEEIHLINISAKERQGGPMAEEYLMPVEPAAEDICRLHGRNRYAVFDPQNTLAGYMIAKRCGEIVGGDRFLGHAERLKEADFMRLLWFKVVSDLIADNDGVQWAWYHLYNVGNPGLIHWKQSVGLKPYIGPVLA